MKNKLIEDINRYIAYLNDSGLYVTVHGKGISGLLEHNIHRNPFCYLVKTDDSAWDKCKSCQQKVLKEHKRERLFGMCYAGIEEYVYFVNDKTFISVSGYAINRERAVERINRLSDEFYLDRGELIRVYENSLKHEMEDDGALDTKIRPLCHMLYLLQLLLADLPQSTSNRTLFDSILDYVQRNFMQSIEIRDIAQACACSESTVSHLFKEYTEVSAKRYIGSLRIEQAKKLLSTSDLPIGTVALMCGFDNINYFPTAFKKAVGVSPTEYRQSG